MELVRSSGILLHITSLPSPFGIGDLGPESYEFIDFLESSGNKYWQLLPLNPTDAGYSHSPYCSDSAFAGNTLLISPELLEKDGYINLQDFELPRKINPGKVDFKIAEGFKKTILEAAFSTFKEKTVPKKFKDFCVEHKHWLNDYSLYKALHHKYNAHWIFWPKELRDRNPSAIKKAGEKLKEEVKKIKFSQYLFFSQWKNLTNYARLNHVALIGDIPFYINHDSADCWANSSYFKLNRNKKPLKISGVPPDYFSETGQLWGTPVYNWKTLKQNRYDWWVERIRQNLLLFDVVRLDHFRGFSAYWEVPAGDKTAENGKWSRSPGHKFFRIIKNEFPEMPFIAEDLGSLDKPVHTLIDAFNFPRMNVLQFAFGGNKADNPYLPFNHRQNSLVYTGTHDNNTTRGWYAEADTTTKLHLAEYANTKITSRNVHKQLHRMALNSVAKIAVIPMQDILGLGYEGIMNIPGSTEGNWTWRMTYDEISIKRAIELKSLNELYGRVNNFQ